MMTTIVFQLMTRQHLTVGADNIPGGDNFKILLDKNLLYNLSICIWLHCNDVMLYSTRKQIQTITIHAYYSTDSPCSLEDLEYGQLLPIDKEMTIHQ